MKCFVDLLLKFKEFMGRHFVRALRSRGSARLQVDDELNISDRWYSRQFFGEDVGEIANDWNVLDSFKGGGIESIHRIDPRFGILGNTGGVVHNLAGGVKELDRLGATI